MKLLAIDSSGLVASVAIVTEHALLAEYTINYKKTHSQTLLPMIDEIVKMTEMDLDSIDGIAIAQGPGSFTGLRIGSATAKGIGLALKKPIIGVSTLDALAYNFYMIDGVICPLMDARRNQVYTGLYTYQENKFYAIEQQMAVSLSEIIEKVNLYSKKTYFLGDGVNVYEEQIKNLIKVPYFFAPLHLSRQRAGAVGALGIIYLKEGKVISAKDYEPIYLRVSQAEREYLKKKDD